MKNFIAPNFIAPACHQRRHRPKATAQLPRLNRASRHCIARSRLPTPTHDIMKLKVVSRSGKDLFPDGLEVKDSVRARRTRTPNPAKSEPG